MNYIIAATAGYEAALVGEEPYNIVSRIPRLVMRLNTFIPGERSERAVIEAIDTATPFHPEWYCRTFNKFVGIFFPQRSV